MTAPVSTSILVLFLTSAIRPTVKCIEGKYLLIEIDIDFLQDEERLEMRTESIWELEKFE